MSGPFRLNIRREVTLHMVNIEGRGGDSAHDEYFLSNKAAVVASAVDGKNQEPTMVSAWQLTDGRFVIPRFVGISKPPSPKQTAKLLVGLSPAQRLVLARTAKGS